MSEQNQPIASIALDFSAAHIDLPAVTEATGQEPTHWYTHFAHFPEPFWVARAIHGDGEDCCWQFRVHGITKHQSNYHIIRDECERIAELFLPRVEQIREVCSRFSIKPYLRIVLDFNDPQSIEMDVGPRMLSFLTAIDAFLTVKVCNAFEPPE